MKINTLLLALVLLICISCNQSKYEKYRVANYFNDNGRDSMLISLVPYFADLLVGMKAENRFDSTSREKFKKILFNWSFERYYVDEDSNYYFIISEIAPSVGTEKDKIAIGGRYKLTPDKKIIQYEELFNTYKMSPEKLSETSDLLMDEMVSKKGDMSKYIGDGKTIEFPDVHVCYDKAKLKWKICVPY